MGIKYVWTILQPFCERKPLYELQGKTVAIDLSGWVCEAQNVTDYNIQPKMYLRNLYFRTCYLLLMDVGLVFVLDGKAPELKYSTIAARNEMQFKGAKPKSRKTKIGKDRSRFTHVLLKCKEMLNLLGLTCITSKGEAEALCANLNEDKLVDGCISQDSDCFAYGAKVVYRNFSISQQGAHAAAGGSVDVYSMDNVLRSINFGRNKIIALALLCGSDYSDGVYGIGKEACLKLFENVDEKDILNKLSSWKSDCDKFNDILSNKNLCSTCGHLGKFQLHTKSGCHKCNTFRGCNLSKFQDERSAIKNEVLMRNKALADTTFPNKDLTDEFLLRKDNILQLDLKWNQPDVIGFVKFVSKNLQWEELYGFQKVFPIFARWQLINYKETSCKSIFPDRIKKCRNQKGVASFEIIWKDPNNHYANLIPKMQLESVDLVKLWSTIEPRNLVEMAYPHLVHNFEESKVKPKKRKVKQKQQVDRIEELATRNTISGLKCKRRIKGDNLKADTVDCYFNKAVLNSLEEQKTCKDLNLDFSTFGDENDLDLSNIVQSIVDRSPPKYINVNLNKLQETNFFISKIDEIDLFEKSVHFLTSNVLDSSDEYDDGDR